ncbi:hypothetical protein PUV54_16200 [Hyphococcus flavus]|uniref:Uncharacterized protein n=1 Tax=Hyphococcus flavus TaxID=1866326 RepID=A0AAE9ZBB0_9PROT|nr:hypothetical protein [Hyphococcus flavus]WDI31494.1 hypothetical protein PUV54_16200 [Hyphococcus flavus]
MMNLKKTFSITGAISLAAFNTAMAETMDAVEDDLFSGDLLELNEAPLSSTELSEARGGFQVGGFVFNIGVTVTPPSINPLPNGPFGDSGSVFGDDGGPFGEGGVFGDDGGPIDDGGVFGPGGVFGNDGPSAGAGQQSAPATTGSNSTQSTPPPANNPQPAASSTQQAATTNTPSQPPVVTTTVTPTTTQPTPNAPAPATVAATPEPSQTVSNQTAPTTQLPTDAGVITVVENTVPATNTAPSTGATDTTTVASASGGSAQTSTPVNNTPTTSINDGMAYGANPKPQNDPSPSGGQETITVADNSAPSGGNSNNFDGGEIYSQYSVETKTPTPQTGQSESSMSATLAQVTDPEVIQRVGTQGILTVLNNTLDNQVIKTQVDVNVTVPNFVHQMGVNRAAALTSYAAVQHVILGGIN